MAAAATFPCAPSQAPPPRALLKAASRPRPLVTSPRGGATEEREGGSSVPTYCVGEAKQGRFGSAPGGVTGDAAARGSPLSSPARAGSGGDARRRGSPAPGTLSPAVPPGLRPLLSSSLPPSAPRSRPRQRGPGAGRAGRGVAPGRSAGGARGPGSGAAAGDGGGYPWPSRLRRPGWTGAGRR